MHKPNISLTGKRVIVTGGAGFIGSHTVERLLSLGASVCIVDNLVTGKMQNIEKALNEPTCSFEHLDVAKGEPLKVLVNAYKPDAIIHLAALVSVQESIHNPELNFERNVLATQAVINAAVSAKVQNLVFASSAAIYGDNDSLPLSEQAEKRPLSPYGGAKLASEALLMATANTYPIRVTVNRYFNVYGPRQDPKSPYSGVMSIFMDRFRNGLAPTVFGDGKQTRDFVNVQDVALANCLGAFSKRSGFQSVNICTGKESSLNDLIEVFREHFPKAPETQFKTARKGDIIHSLGNPSQAFDTLGFQATITLREGLSNYIQSQHVATH